jgi:glycosyltransferase involved in cell wall biosynthesis
MFRMVKAAEDAGHECTIVLYNPHGSDLKVRERIIRESWPDIRADVRPLTPGLAGYDAGVATAWQTAHALARYGTSPMRRLYFIQDYEPFFYPRGTEYALAEQSYHFGFRLIALGKMVASRLASESQVAADVVPFGCDTATYHVSSPRAREGVVFYTMPGNARRGFLLNRMALELFRSSHPDVPIHAYGDGRRSDLPFPVEWHGRLLPAELNELYSQTIAGLAMSFTNISLVAEEMLAAGCIPVVNDYDDARADLDNPFVAWTRPNPAAIAKRLAEIVSGSEIDAVAARAAVSVRPNWSEAQSGVVAVIENDVYGD